MNINTNEIESKLRNIFKSNNLNLDIDFQYSSFEDYDIQCSSLLKEKNNDLIKSIKGQITEAFIGLNEIEKFEITENGFINIRFSENHLYKLVENNFCRVDKKQHILFDYGGPNIGKALHVGHLRTLNIGRALYNINKHAGNEVTSDVHFGDWGMPISQIIGYIEYKDLDINSIEYKDLELIYPESVELSKQDKGFEELCKNIAKELNLKNKKYLSKWSLIHKLSVEEIKLLFIQLQHKFDLFYGESDVIDEANCVIDRAKKDKKVKFDDLALVSTEERTPPVIIAKSDGSFLYMTTDLGTVLFRENKNVYDKYIYVVDYRQKEHFSQLFSTVKHFELSNSEFIHVGYGTVNGKNGKPLKTREGGVYKLVDLYSDVKKLLTKEGMSEKDLNKLTNSVLTYSDLLSNRKQNYVFDIDKFVDINGKTAVYLQYSQVRAARLLEEYKKIIKFENLMELNNTERNLLFLITKFPYYFNLSIEKNEPHHLAEYAYNLSSVFNSFYTNNKIFSEDISEGTKLKRIYIVKKFYKTLIDIFNCLGIEPVKKM
tara:strand:- start:831 stop:2462 length:1632 start_codon:yes stop_codon:yes gene_type:complete